MILEVEHGRFLKPEYVKEHLYEVADKIKEYADRIKVIPNETRSMTIEAEISVDEITYIAITTSILSDPRVRKARENR